VDLPERCDIAVIGGGLAGLLVADRLADSGSVTLITRGDVTSATSRTSGIVACGAQDSPARLLLGLGEERACRYWQWSAASGASLLDLAAELGVAHTRTGSWRVALEERELSEWSTSLGLLNRWDPEGPAGWRAASPQDLENIGTGFVGAVFVPGDGWLDVAALCAALRGRLEGRVAHSSAGARLVGADDSGAKVLELGSGSRLHAEVVVIGAGWNSPAVEARLETMLYPVRLQALRTEPVAAGAVPVPVLARHRFETWCQEPGGELVFSGCRWAEQPEMGAGISDCEDRSAAVLERQQEFIAAHLPFAGGAAVRSHWSGIAAWSCDGLPLVGTLPGDPRVTVLGGWGGAGLSLVAGAATAICDGLTGRQGEGAPAFLHPRRML
jgi:glycine/D-amino acid oxidase-like deaminating enzyme